jgi:plastocyanin
MLKNKKLLVLILAVFIATLISGCSEVSQEVTHEEIGHDDSDGHHDEDAKSEISDNSEDTVDESESEVVEIPLSIEDEKEEVAQAKTVTYVVEGSSFKFMVDGEENPDIKVNVGDTVIIDFTSASGTHDWTLDEFGAQTATVSSGESDTIEFVATETGEFEYYCSIGSHRVSGMEGKFIVE